MEEVVNQNPEIETPAPEIPKWRKALTIVEWVLICALLIFDIFIISMRYSSSDSGATNFFGNQVYVVLTGSMEGSPEFYAEHPEYEIKACPIDSAVLVDHAPAYISTEDEKDPAIVKEKQAKIDAYYEKVKVGDVLTFYYSVGKTVIVTHRIINKSVTQSEGRNVYTFILRGDNPSGDKVVSPTSPTQVVNSTMGLIIGKVNKVDMGLGWFLTHFVNNKVLIGILILVPAAIMFFYEVGKIIILVYQQKHGSKAALERAELEALRAQIADMQQTPAPAPSPAKEDPLETLRKYKSMLDEGLITQEEYDAKKAELLK